MLNMYKYLAILFLFAGALYLAHQHGYKNGYNEASIQAQKGIDSLQAIINKSNTEAVNLANKQRDSINKALAIRDQQYKQTTYDLTAKLKHIERLKNESKNTCVNSIIPDGFK